MTARTIRRGTLRQKAPVGLTGGEGFRFENSVAARFLLDLLSGTNSLGSEFGRIVRLDWQARDAGWLTEDLAVTLNLHQNPAETLHIRRLDNGLERPCGRSRPAPRHLASLVAADAFAG